MAKQSKTTARPRKKVATKKVAKKAAKKKTATKRTTRKKTPAKQVTLSKVSGAHPNDLQTQLDVWGSYARLRSKRAVVRELAIAEWIVRDVLASDQQRLIALIDEEMENLVSQWETTHGRAHRLMADLLDIADGLITEIKTAAAEGRVTTIRDRDGFPMPVLDAMQFVVMTKLLDQLARIAEKAQQISTAYRTGHPFAEAEKRAGGSHAGGKPLDAMDDLELAHVIEAGGIKLPDILVRKVKQVESDRRQA